MPVITMYTPSPCKYLVKNFTKVESGKYCHMGLWMFWDIKLNWRFLCFLATFKADVGVTITLQCSCAYMQQGDSHAKAYSTLCKIKTPLLKRAAYEFSTLFKLGKYQLLSYQMTDGIMTSIPKIPDCQVTWYQKLTGKKQTNILFWSCRQYSRSQIQLAFLWKW